MKCKYRHSVIFGSPYKDPPKGLPRILVSIETDHHLPPERFNQKRSKILQRLFVNGITGFFAGFESIPISDKKRAWSEEAKKKNRLKRLYARQSKKYSIPELLHKAVQDEISKNPSYYLP